MKKIIMTLLVFASTSAFAGDIYRCVCRDNHCTVDQKVELTKKKISLSAWSAKEDTYKEAEVFTATRNMAYKPRNPNSHKVAYKTDCRDVVLSESMLDSANHGYLSIRGCEDGFWSAEFECYLRR